MQLGYTHAIWGTRSSHKPYNWGRESIVYLKPFNKHLINVKITHKIQRHY